MTETVTWDDIDPTRPWERLPIKTNVGFPYVQYVNHEGWVYRYVFSKNTHEGFLVMDVVRVFDQERVFHGKINAYDIVKARDPITKTIRFYWFAFQIDFDKQDIVIYAFYRNDWVR